MKFVFRISNRLRSAQPIPRDFMPIKGIEHLGLVYQQRVIETAEDFNASLAAINDPRFPGRGCSFFPYALTDEEIAKMNGTPAPEPEPAQVEESPEEPVAEWNAPQPDAEYVVAVDPPAEEEPAPVETPEVSSKFRLVGNDIFMGEERVGGIYENGLRCSKGFADLRDEIEAWLNSQPQ